MKAGSFKQVRSIILGQEVIFWCWEKKWGDLFCKASGEIINHFLSGEVVLAVF